MKTEQQGTVVAVFPTRERAEQAVAELVRAGFRTDQVGLVAKDAGGKTVRTDAAGGTNAAEGAAIGAAAGAGIGGLVGLGVLTGVIPVLGPVMALGTLGTILANAAGGAALAGLAGALVGWGIPEEDAKYYEGEVQAGRYLVTVAAAGRADEARRILHGHAGYDRASATRTTTAAAGGAGQTVQLKEEHLRASKEAVKTGDVTVRKEVHTEHQQVTVPVEREEVVIERRPASGPAAGEIKAEEIRIPVKEEKVHVSKEAVVKEEVSVGKRKVTETETVAGEVKKEELKVETEGDVKVRKGDAGKK